MPLAPLKEFVPWNWTATCMDIIRSTNINIEHIQIFSQLLLLGDASIIIVFLITLLGSIIKKVVLIFVSMAISIWLLQFTGII
jgi:hypothetical protein